jgi:hypothetical protein
MLRKSLAYIGDFAVLDQPKLQKFADKSSITRKVVKYNPDFVYARFRAIGCLEVDGPNSNADAFPYGEFLDERPGYGYKSFEGKHAFVEHASDNINNAIGDLYSSYLNRFDLSKFGSKEWRVLNDDERARVLTTRAKHEDGSIEVLMAINSKLAPKIATIIGSGSPAGCSMGTNIDYSECSVCGNRAYTEQSYCPHIKHSKNQRILVQAQQIAQLLDKGVLRSEWLPYILSRVDDIKAVKHSGRKMVYAKVFEVNYGLSFFELSVVANPAFTRGYKLEKVASTSAILRPTVQIDNKPVELALSVPAELVTGILQSYANRFSKPLSSWTAEERLLVTSDGDIAKMALENGQVYDVSVDRKYAPSISRSGMTLGPNNENSYYTIENPDKLLSMPFLRKSFASLNVVNENSRGKTLSMSKTASKSVLSITPEGDKAHAALKEKYPFHKDAGISFLKTAGKDGALLALFGNVSSEENKLASIDDHIDLMTKSSLDPKIVIEALNDGLVVVSKYEGDSGGLPSTAEFTGDKIVEGGNPQDTEVSELYKPWAEKGSNQWHKENEEKHDMGSPLFVDSIIAKKDASDRKEKTAKLTEVAKRLYIMAKLAFGPAGLGEKPMGPTPEFKDKFDSFNKDMGPEPPELGGGMALEIDIAPADLPEVIQNTISDLDKIVDDLESASGMLESRETEATEALANKRRWNRQLVAASTKTASEVDSIISDAIEAIQDAKSKLQVAYDQEIGAPAGEESLGDTTFGDSPKPSESPAESKPESKPAEKKEPSEKKPPFESKKDEKNEHKKSEKKDEGDDMSKEAGVITPETIKSLASLKALLTKSSSEESEEKEDEKEEKEDEKEEKEGASVKETKTATAMPPTGARDPGDYGKAGGIEAFELGAWQDMYKSFTQMKGEELSKDLNNPDSKIDLLTGSMAGGESAATEKLPGDAGTTKAIFSTRTLNKLEPKKSFYTVMVKKADGTVDGFISNFTDAAGETGTEQDYDTFVSDGYRDLIHETIASNDGFMKAMADMGGRRPKEYTPGVTPGTTEKVNPLYDSEEEKKSSGKSREGMRPGEKEGHKSGSDKQYYSKAFGDSGYAADLVKANQKIASLTEELNKVASEKQALETREKARIMSDHALWLSRLAASRNVIPFSASSIQKQATEYVRMEATALEQVKKHLLALPIVNRRALEAYQIPEAENMEGGVVHNALNAVEKARYQNTEDNVSPDGLQPAVESAAKISSDQQNHVRKQATVAPQLYVDNAGVPQQVPDFTGRFSTIENRLAKRGALEDALQKGHLRSNRKN